MSVRYDDLETLFLERGLSRRPDGSFWEDSYDYGVWWLDRDGAAHRLTWIGPQRRANPEKAGELYLVRMLPAPGPSPRTVQEAIGRGRRRLEEGPAGPGLVELLCIIPPRLHDSPLRYEERAIPPMDGLVEEILVGWAEACGAVGSVDWVRDRVREAIEAGWAFAP